MINLWWSVFAVAAFSAGSLHDVGVENIVNPPLGHNNAIVPGETLSVVAQIRNYGFRAETLFDVRLKISDLSVQPDTVVFDTIATVDSLDWRGNQAGNPDRVDITFPVWNIPKTISFCYEIEVRTLLAQDHIPANNFITLQATPGYIMMNVNEGTTNPERFGIKKIIPDPGRGFFEIDYTLPAETYLSIGIFDITGRKIKTLFHGQQPSGDWKTFWDGKDDRRQKPGAGVYLIRLETPKYQATKKVIFCKPR